jgi:hypothetical protein
MFLGPNMLFAQAEQINDIANKLQTNNTFLIKIAIGAGILFALFIILKVVFGRRGAPDLQKGQRESLAEFPPPPPIGDRQLKVNGMPVRIRLVVVAPTGSAQDPIGNDDVFSILNEVTHGLGSVARSDKPRVRVWPPQLSVAGFAPTFHRLVDATDASKNGKRWIKLAGHAKTSGRPVLVGLAVLADEATSMNELTLSATDWQELCQVAR